MQNLDGTMEVGDLVLIHNAPFDGKSLFVYQNGDLGVIRGKIRGMSRSYSTCIVMLLKDLNEYHIPITYMKKMEAPC